MKKLMLLGLMAIGSVAALAAPVKTSKPVVLSDSEMESIKGLGIYTVWTWNSYYEYYELTGVNSTGEFGPSFTIVQGGGPQDGMYPYNYEPWPHN